MALAPLLAVLPVMVLPLTITGPSLWIPPPKLAVPTRPPVEEVDLDPGRQLLLRTVGIVRISGGFSTGGGFTGCTAPGALPAFCAGAGCGTGCGAGGGAGMSSPRTDPRDQSGSTSSPVTA